jgi:hypothetical protein
LEESVPRVTACTGECNLLNCKHIAHPDGTSGLPACQFLVQLVQLHIILTFPDDRCVVRYGYKDVHKDDHDFENQLIVNLAEFIRTENEATYIPSSSEVTTDERMAVMGNTLSTMTLHAFGTGSDFEQSSVSIQTRVSPVARFQVQFFLLFIFQVGFQIWRSLTTLECIEHRY